MATASLASISHLTPDTSVLALPINAVAPDLPVAGPAPELAEELRELHLRSAT